MPRRRAARHPLAPLVLLMASMPGWVAVACGGSGSTHAAGDGAAPAISSSPDGAPEDEAGPGQDGGGSGSSSGGSGSGSGGSSGGDGGHKADAGASGLHVVKGTGGSPGHIVDGSGSTVQLHGVDRSGTEYSCLYGSFFDGPADQTAIDAMKTWKVNAVRVPLNEDCWLGINGVLAGYGGAPYQQAIGTWVDLITSNGMVAVLDLHWTAPGATLAKAQAPMADADHSPAFWSQVAKTFAKNGNVVFDLFNEPYITDWTCWLVGGSCATLNGQSYAVAGMASLLKAVRQAGAQNVVILGGLGYSSDMSQWVAQVESLPKLAPPLDGLDTKNVAASWHAYDFNSEQSGCPSQYNGYSMSLTCSTAEQTATATSATTVLSGGYPVVIGELGISAYSASTAMPFTAAQVMDLETWLDGMCTWAEMQGQGYLAWSWNTDTPPELLTDYTGTPSPYFGQTYEAHLKKF